MKSLIITLILLMNFLYIPIAKCSEYSEVVFAVGEPECSNCEENYPETGDNELRENGRPEDESAPRQDFEYINVIVVSTINGHIENLNRDLDKIKKDLSTNLIAIAGPGDRTISSGKYLATSEINLKAVAGSKMSGQINAAAIKLERNTKSALDKAKKDIYREFANNPVGLDRDRVLLETKGKVYNAILDGFSSIESISNEVMQDGFANLDHGFNSGGNSPFEVPTQEWKGANNYFTENSDDKAERSFGAGLSNNEEQLLRDAGFNVPSFADEKVKTPTPISIPGSGNLSEEDKNFYARNDEIYNKLTNTHPFHEQGKLAKAVGIEASLLASSAYKNNLKNHAYVSQKIAEAMLEIATGTLPVISTGRDIYEAITGKNLLTGATLTNLERSLALVGIATLGASHFTRVVPVLAKNLPEFTKIVSNIASNLKVPGVVGQGAVSIASSAAKLGLKSADDIKRNIGIIERWLPHFDVKKVDDAANINAKMIEKGMEPAYKSGTKVIEFETKAADTWVRAHGQANQARPWMMREVDINGLSGKQIAEKFNIKDIPTMISIVDVPPGTTVRIGSVGRNSFGTAEGAIQYEIRMPNDDFIPAGWFTKIRDL